MKLSARDLTGFIQRPDPKMAGVLLYGEDTMRVALKRQDLVKAICGPNAEEEMRLTRILGADLRRDPAQVLDAVKAVGFFPGPRVVLVDEANNTATDALAPALQDWREGDAQIVVTAGALQKTASLRKLFEGTRNACAAALFNDPPGRAEIEADLKHAGLRDVSRDAMGALEVLARSLTPGDLRQTIEKIGLYKHGDAAPLTPDEVALMAPASVEAEIDDVFDIVAEGRLTEMAPVMQRLEAQGVAPVTLLIMAMRHFRTLYALSSAPGGGGQAVRVFGPRRDRLMRQAERWRTERLEEALMQLMDTDLALRSAGQKAPAMALVERAFVRLAVLATRQG
ncbi:DNA polymerase III subunit delta [Thetidibacter halocola]|uniref:DNA-directed DNA polymerase n=1 Tax=Thetidibacter halocola TaxID=2827239 RepID=A0A8J7WDC4_9RHOB|nr:DNA polymerase III subunit delta [Thetidibacter halocola]